MKSPNYLFMGSKVFSETIEKLRVAAQATAGSAQDLSRQPENKKMALVSGPLLMSGMGRGVTALGVKLIDLELNSVIPVKTIQDMPDSETMAP